MDGAKRVRTVMISSTVLDLPEHREEARSACEQQNMLPMMMERMPASASNAIRESTAMVDDADVYLEIIGFRYGYVPSGNTLSITEMEYDRAIELGIPCLVFLMDDSHSVRRGDVEQGANATKLEAFRQRLTATHVVKFFTSPQDLRAHIVNALSQFRREPAQADLLRSQVSGTRYRVAIINQSTAASDEQVSAVVAALQTQIRRDFAPAWGVDADLTFVPSGAEPPAECWWMLILDETDNPGWLGYRDLTPEGLPRAKVFVKSAREVGVNWSKTTSHVLLEMLLNPKSNLMVFRGSADAAPRLYAYEACTPCTSDDDGYEIDRVLVSDFVYPASFESFRLSSSTKFDQADRMTRPFQVLDKGYVTVLDTVDARWSSRFGRDANQPSRRPPPLSEKSSLAPKKSPRAPQKSPRPPQKSSGAGKKSSRSGSFRPRNGGR